MDYQQILELVKEVSKAGLTNFEYTEGNIRIAWFHNGIYMAKHIRLSPKALQP